MSGGSPESVSSLSGNNTGPPNQQSVSVSSNTAGKISDLDKLKKGIADKLNDYLEQRESSIRLQIDNKLDISYLDPNNYSNKKRFLIEVYQELANTKNSDDIAKLIKKLPSRAELTTDENSRFKKTLYEIYDATAKKLYEIDSAKYGDLHTQSNKHFDEQIINSIRKQKDNRKQTTSNGVAGFFKSLYQNGLVNTVNEGFLHNRDKKREHLQFANHFINQLKNKGGKASAEDYVQFINQAALIIKKLKDDGDNNAGLDKELQAIQEKIIKRYLIEKRPPEFTAEQKLAIFDAFKMNHAIDSPMIKQMSDILKADKILFDNKLSPSIRPTLIKMKAEALAEKIKTDANSPERIAKRNQTKVDEFADEFRNSLYAKFTAELAMHSGEIDGTNNAAASGVASGLNVASKLSYLSGIPVLPQICGITAQMVKGIDNELAESSHATAAKSLKSFSHQDKLVYYTVSKVCLRYLEQIQSLDKSEVNEMGKQAAERIVDYIRSGKFKASGNVEDDAEKLAIAITSHEFRHGSLPGINKSVALEHGAKSHGSAEGIFTKPGIMVIGKDGKPKYYAKDGISPKYGFILGTKEEVDEWRYVPVAGPSDLHPVIKALEKNQQSTQSALPVSAPTHLEDQQYTKSISDNSDQLSKTLLSNPPGISHTTVDTAKMKELVPKLTSDTAKQLGNYLENRLNNKRLKIYDTFSDKIKDHNSITNKKSAIRKICHQLANVKTTSEYIDFLKTIKTEADKISDKSSGLKKLLVKIHDETANKLYADDKNNLELLNACHVANKAFTSRHINEFNEFTASRNATSSKGTTGFFKGVYNSGLINTINENLRHQFDLKNNQIRYANYFSDKLNQCKSSDDYTQFIIESSWAINKLGKAGRENADLVKILTASRDETLQRFLNNDRQPPLSLEQKELIRDALRQINNQKDNEILKSVATNIKTIDPNHNEVNLERSEQATEILKHTETNIFATDIEKNNDAKRNQFTETLVAKLYAHTVAALIVESGNIQGNQNATQRTQGALGLASKIGEISGIPLYSHVCDFAKHSMSGIDNTSQTGKRKNMTASFDSYSQQDQLIHKTAAKICLRYMEQINRLDANEVEDFAIHVSERIVDYIKAGKFQTTGDLAKDTDELAIAVANHELRHGALSLSKKSVAHNGTDKQSWNVEGALSKPGIIVLDENGKPHYYSKNGEPPKYGYMLGTQEEVDHWKMKAVAQEKIPSQHPIAQLKEKIKKDQATTEPRKKEDISQNNDPSVITANTKPSTNINRAFKDIAQDIKNGLNKYKKHREENVRLKIYDTFSNNTRDYDSRDNRIKTVNSLLEQLEELKSKKDATSTEYVQFLQKLSKEADQITDNKSLLKKTLTKLYDQAGNDLKSFPGTENISEFKLACNKANTHFNNRILCSLDEYSQNRQFASAGGFVNQLKSLYYNGVVNTAREGVLEDVKKKNEHIALADYCSHQIKQCEQAKPEDKTKAYVNLMISCAEMLQRLKKDSSNNGDLNKYLQTYQKMIWKRFAETNKDPAFSLEDKKAIYHALKSYNNKDNADLLKKVEQAIEKEEKGYIADTAIHPTKQSLETLQKEHSTQLDGFINDVNRTADKTKQQQQDFQQIFKQQLHARFISTLAVHSGKITDHTVLSKTFSRISDTIDSDSATKKNRGAVDTVKSFEYLEKLMNKVSEKTIERYAEQINFLDSSSVNKVATFAAERAMAYIKSGKFSSTGDIEKDTAAIVQGITAQELHHGVVPLFNKRIAQNKSSDKHYSAEGFFAKPGIICLGEDGKIKFYNNDGTQPTKYGYIFATEKEALDRGMKVVTTDMNKSEAEKNNHPAYTIGLQKQSELVQSSTVTHSAPESSEKLPSDIAPRSIRLRAVTTTPHVQRNHDLPITENSRKTESNGTSHKYCDRHPNDVQKITKVTSLNPPPSAPKSVIKPTVPSTIVTPLSPRPRGGSMR